MAIDHECDPAQPRSDARDLRRVLSGLGPRVRPSRVPNILRAPNILRVPNIVLVPNIAPALIVAVVALALFGATAAARDGGPSPLANAGPAQSEAPSRGAPGLRGWSGPKPKIDCHCRRPGGAKALVGEEICVRRGGDLVTMRCEMRLNNTIWTSIRQGCADPVS